MQKEFVDSSITITGKCIYIFDKHISNTSIFVFKVYFCTCRLHAMMREKIGGELIRWNATRFGTVFIFLQSFWDRQDKFMQWMVSDDWKNNAWKDEADHAFTYDCLLNRRWWSDMELVLNAVTPIYTVLRYADQQKNATIAGFLPKIMTAMAQIRGNLSKEKDLLDRIVGVIKKRLKYMVDDTLIVAGKR
jgi:hypothetical protein